MESAQTRAWHHLASMRIPCHHKPEGFKEGCAEGVYDSHKDKQCFLPRNTKEDSHLTRVFSVRVTKTII